MPRSREQLRLEMERRERDALLDNPPFIREIGSREPAQPLVLVSRVTRAHPLRYPDSTNAVEFTAYHGHRTCQYVMAGSLVERIMRDFSTEQARERHTLRLIEREWERYMGERVVCRFHDEGWRTPDVVDAREAAVWHQGGVLSQNDLHDLHFGMTGPEVVIPRSRLTRRQPYVYQGPIRYEELTRDGVETHQVGGTMRVSEQTFRQLREADMENLPIRVGDRSARIGTVTASRPRPDGTLEVDLHIHSGDVERSMARMVDSLREQTMSALAAGRSFEDIHRNGLWEERQRRRGHADSIGVIADHKPTDWEA